MWDCSERGTSEAVCTDTGWEEENGRTEFLWRWFSEIYYVLSDRRARKQGPAPEWDNLHVAVVSHHA